MNGNTSKPQDMAKMMLDELQDMYKSMVDMTDNSLKSNYHCRDNVYEVLSVTMIDDIDTMSFDELKNFVNSFSDADKFQEEYVNMVSNRYPFEEMDIHKNLNIPEKPDTFKGYLIQQIKLMWEMICKVNLIKSQVIELKTQLVESRTNASDKFDDKTNIVRSEIIDKLKADLANVEDGDPKKKEIEVKIRIMDNCTTFSFLFNRITDPKIKEKERDVIKRGFFKVSEGSLIMDKYKSKIKKFGFGGDIVPHLLGLEELFLSEKYHPFNNLFLFNYMRYTAYADPDNIEERMYVQAITDSLVSLVYHRLTDEKRDYLISIIEKFDNLFLYDKDKFIEANTTNPDHEYRIERDKGTREKITAYLNENGIEYSDNMPLRQLQELYSNSFKEKEKEVLNEYMKLHPDETIHKEDIPDEIVTEDNNDLVETEGTEGVDFTENPIGFDEIPGEEIHTNY